MAGEDDLAVSEIICDAQPFSERNVILPNQFRRNWRNAGEGGFSMSVWGIS